MFHRAQHVKVCIVLVALAIFWGFRKWLAQCTHRLALCAHVHAHVHVKDLTALRLKLPLSLVKSFVIFCDVQTGSRLAQAQTQDDLLLLPLFGMFTQRPMARVGFRGCLVLYSNVSV